MKQFFYLILAGILFSNTARAGAGDTTWVQAHVDSMFDHYGNFDAGVRFPDASKTYRKIIMVFTLGKYPCPGSPQYCADWDYTVQNFLMTPGGDTLELGRLITPYGNGARMVAGWKQRYMFDVTDFYPVLTDTAAVRIHYSGYSWGFTGNIKFAFIEGTPPRNVLDIERLWKGSVAYGNASNPTTTQIPEMNKTAPVNTQHTEMKFTITGHGADNQGCSEFCKKYYQVILNKAIAGQKDIWRDDCGSNHLYPQNGTWIYDRGNWCPGDLIKPNVHTLAGVTGGTSYDIDVDLEPYTNATPSGSYIIESGVWYYGGFNRANDASIEDIIAPSDFEVHFRENPRNSNPLIRVKNVGGSNITSLKIEYGIGGRNKHTYTWQGMIAPLEEQTISLPQMYELQSQTQKGTFTATILESNGQTDEDQWNNTLTSTFDPVPQWPSKFIVIMRTNNDNDVKWTIRRSSDNGIEQQSQATLLSNKTYNDTVSLSSGTYYLEIEDAGCNGLAWWANANGGNGTLTIRPATGGPTSYQMKGYYSGDFGCGFKQYFNIGWPQSVTDVESIEATLNAYPNPARDAVQVFVDGLADVHGTMQVIDATGRVVMQQVCNTANITINTAMLANGMYTIQYIDGGATSLKTRIIVAK
jgi:hypothetical protein